MCAMNHEQAFNALESLISIAILLVLVWLVFNDE